MCQWVPASTGATLVAALRQEQLAARAAAPASRDEVARREPLRVIRDSYPSFSGLAVDTERDEVYAADENLLQILVYDRLDNTPETATMTEPRRVLGGPQTEIEFVCGLYSDQNAGEIYASHGDTGRVLVFSRTQQGGCFRKQLLMRRL